MDNSAEAGLALYNHIRDTHLAAESGQEDDEFNRVNIVSNDNEGSLLRFDEGDNVVETILDEERLLGLRGGLAISSGSSSSTDTLLLLLLGLWAVLVKELEELGSCVLVEGVRELRNGGGNLQTLVKDNLLALEANVLGPLDEASQISLRADVLAYTKVFGSGLEERVFLGLCLLAGAKRSGGGLFTRSWLGFGGLVIETKLAMDILVRIAHCASEL